MDPKQPLTEEEFREMFKEIYFRNKYRSHGNWMFGLVYADYCSGITKEEIEHLQSLYRFFISGSSRISQARKDEVRAEFKEMVNAIRKEGRKKLSSHRKTYIEMFNDPKPKPSFANVCEDFLDLIVNGL